MDEIRKKLVHIMTTNGIQKAHEWVDQYTPIRTGTYRAELHQWINDTTHHPVPYAKIVPPAPKEVKHLWEYQKETTLFQNGIIQWNQAEIRRVYTNKPENFQMGLFVTKDRGFQPIIVMEPCRKEVPEIYFGIIQSLADYHDGILTVQITNAEILNRAFLGLRPIMDLINVKNKICIHFKRYLWAKHILLPNQMKDYWAIIRRVFEDLITQIQYRDIHRYGNNRIWLYFYNGNTLLFDRQDLGDDESQDTVMKSMWETIFLPRLSRLYPNEFTGPELSLNTEYDLML